MVAGASEVDNPDLEILAGLAELVKKHLPALISTRSRTLVAEFTRGLLSELVFSREAINLERFSRFYVIIYKVKMPRLYRPLRSERVLIMERVEGLKFNDLDDLKKSRYDINFLAAFGTEVILEQIITFGYFHGDSHSGNLFVQSGP
ncbi:MAG: hypothetical protein AMR96_06040 [Candidatus Adiutrix intracellularis]|jgi:ubiquinone biosynthesis protein|nr:MAG: hypothetical protein AMR96_06040 [Candidatus Adiutrix intracellularis]MDR2827054.1 hypothetical protein [Candidatus Adiutrix intracellularis]